MQTRRNSVGGSPPKNSMMKRRFPQSKPITSTIPIKPLSKVLQLFQNYTANARKRDKRRQLRVEAKQNYYLKLKHHNAAQKDMKALLMKSVSKLNAKMEDFDRDFESDISAESEEAREELVIKANYFMKEAKEI